MDLITRQDPILWYDQVQLFEDELHDNGVSTISVKVRVMPMFFLILWYICVNLYFLHI